MFLWISDNSDAIVAIGSVLSALIWMVYLQIFIMTYMRTQRPRVFIEHGNSPRLDSRFMIINLSKEPIHISGILISVNTKDGEERVRLISDYDHAAQESDEEIYQQDDIRRQGPLQPASFLVLGRGTEIFGTPFMEGFIDSEKSMESQITENLEEVESFEIRVVAIYGAHDRPFGVRRRFQVSSDGDEFSRIDAVDAWTEQLTGRQDRETIEEWAKAVQTLG